MRLALICGDFADVIDGTGPWYRLGQFEVAEDSRCGAADEVGIALARERDIESMKSPFAAFVVFEGVDSGDPDFDRGVAEFLNDVEEVFAQLVGEFVDVLIDIQERGDEAAGVGRERGKVGELL